MITKLVEVVEKVGNKLFAGFKMLEYVINFIKFAFKKMVKNWKNFDYLYHVKYQLSI